MLTENPMLRCDAALTNAFADMLTEIPGISLRSGVRASGSDDYAEITSRIPSAYFFLAAGIDDATQYPSHHPAVRFNEDVLSLGSAIYAHCAAEWLKAQ